MIFTLAATIAATMLAVTRERDAITICLCMGKKEKIGIRIRTFVQLPGRPSMK